MWNWPRSGYPHPRTFTFSKALSDLLPRYMSTLTLDVITWLENVLETDKKDWVKDAEPET